MSLTSYRAAPPRVNLCGSMPLILLLRKNKRPLARPSTHWRAVFRIEKLFNVRLADLAATYSPAS